MAGSLEIEQIRELLAGTRKVLLDAVSEIPNEKFDWKPCPSASSTRAILGHLGLWEAFFLSVIAGDRPRQATDLETLSGRQALLDRLEGIRAETLQAVRELGPMGLDEVRELPVGQSTVRGILLRLLRHEHYHAGQIAYISFLLHPEAAGPALPRPPL